MKAIINSATGPVRFESIDGRGVEIEFPGKPAADVRNCLKFHGFRWSPREKLWWNTRHTSAEKCLAGLRALLEPTPPRTPTGPCWNCQAPAGYMRNMGPATPVWCDPCYAAHVAAEWKRNPAIARHNYGADSQPRADNSSAEDSICGDMAYEDQCRDACGL